MNAGHARNLEPRAVGKSGSVFGDPVVATAILDQLVALSAESSNGSAI
jgi:hypothetical protein